MIESALDLMQSKGLHYFNARAVTSRIGYSVGTLYNLFEGMEGLMLEVNVRTLDKLIMAITKTIKKVEGPKQLGGLIARTYLKFAKDHPAQWTLLFETPTKKRPSWYQKIVAEKFTEIEALLLPFLAIDTSKIRQTCEILWASLHGICMLSHRGKLMIKDTEEMCDTLFHNYLKGVALP